MKQSWYTIYARKMDSDFARVAQLKGENLTELVLSALWSVYGKANVCGLQGRWPNNEVKRLIKTGMPLPLAE
jgi:hypothetical protein